MTLSSESALMAFWMAALFVLASGYPGMKVLIGVNAMIENMTAHMITMLHTIVMVKVVRVNLTDFSC
jgi:hypothetical protein